MGLIFDLAVLALALLVVGSLALLAWTLAVPSVRSLRAALDDVAEVRQRVRHHERSLASRLAARTTVDTPEIETDR